MTPWYFFFDFSGFAPPITLPSVSRAAGGAGLPNYFIDQPPAWVRPDLRDFLIELAFYVQALAHNVRRISALPLQLWEDSGAFLAPSTDGRAVRVYDSTGSLYAVLTNAGIEVVGGNGTIQAPDGTLSLQAGTGGTQRSLQLTADGTFVFSYGSGAATLAGAGGNPLQVRAPIASHVSLQDPTGDNVVLVDHSGVASRLGFFNAGPVPLQTAGGVVAGFVENAGITVRHNSTFTGGVGATAYTLGDVVAALKQYGLLAQ